MTTIARWFRGSLALASFVTPIAPGAAQTAFPDLKPDEVITGRAKTNPPFQGAVLCRSPAALGFVMAQGQSGTMPNLTALGCTLVDAGSPVTIEKEGENWIVRGETMLGVKVQGSSDPSMIELD